MLFELVFDLDDVGDDDGVDDEEQGVFNLLLLVIENNSFIETNSLST